MINIVIRESQKSCLLKKRKVAIKECGALLPSEYCIIMSYKGKEEMLLVVVIMSQSLCMQSFEVSHETILGLSPLTASTDKCEAI